MEIGGDRLEGGDFAQSEETLPRDEHVGSFADTDGDPA